MENFDSEKFYNAYEIYKFGFFKWCHSYPTVIKWINRDMQNWNILGAVKVPGLGISGDRYHIKGSNILKFIAQFEDGSLNYAKEIK